MRMAQSRLRLRLMVLASLAILALLLPSMAFAAPVEAAAESAPTWYGGCSNYHTVRYGQTLSGIAKYYGVSQQAIMQENDIWNASKIYAGQKLCIPGGYDPGPDHGDDWGHGCNAWHYVTYGQTLSHIAKYFGVSMYAIMQANNLYDANHIYVGQKLCIPGGYVPEPPAPHQPPSGCWSWHTVKHGDTLNKIASWYGTSVWALMQYNNISNPNHIYIGQSLKVPGKNCGGPYYPPPDPCPCPPPPPPPNPCPCPPVPPVPPVPSGPWYGEYFNNSNLSGGPSYTANVEHVSFNWGFGGPGNGLSGSAFSGRWTRQEWLQGGTYRFYATSDDGVRVFVDEQLVIDGWKIQAATTYYGEKALSDGYHTIRVEYFQGGGEALLYFYYNRY